MTGCKANEWVNLVSTLERRFLSVVGNVGDVIFHLIFFQSRENDHYWTFMTSRGTHLGESSHWGQMPHYVIDLRMTVFFPKTCRAGQTCFKYTFHHD